jgi:hypothetical protein
VYRRLGSSPFRPFRDLDAAPHFEECLIDELVEAGLLALMLGDLSVSGSSLMAKDNDHSILMIKVPSIRRYETKYLKASRRLLRVTAA